MFLKAFCIFGFFEKNEVKFSVCCKNDEDSLSCSKMNAENFSNWDEDSSSSEAPENANVDTRSIFSCLHFELPSRILCSEGLKLCNGDKNRYSDVIPVDKTRVVLNIDDSKTSNGYINANFLSLAPERTMIATQGPKSNTVVDFWRMIFQYRVPLILMATALREKDKEKSVKYWPDEGKKLFVSGFEIRTIRTEYVSSSISVSEIEVTKLQEDPHTVFHIYYTGCADYSSPDEDSLCDVFLILEQLWSDRSTPFVCHCSAGVGRTGIIATILSYFFRQTSEPKKKDEIVLIVKNILTELRTERNGLVQTLEQFEFVIDFIERNQLFLKNFF